MSAAAPRSLSVAPRSGGLDRCENRRVGQPSGLAHHCKLGLGLDQALAAHDVRCILQAAEPVQRGLDQPAVGGRQPVGRKLAADTRAAQAKLLQYRPQVLRRVGLLGIEPDANVVVERRGLGLSQVRAPGQQDSGPLVGGDHAGLEEDVAGRVVAGEVVVALLREDEKRIQPPAVQFRTRGRQAGGMLLRRKAQRHGAAARSRRLDFLKCPAGHCSSQMSHMVTR